MERTCPHCGKGIKQRNPSPTVDVVVHLPQKGVLLVRRANPPYGWALPGGFVDYGETVEQAAVREAREETGLNVELTGLLGVYSDPLRDPRQHTMSVVFTAGVKGTDRPKAGDDAADAVYFPVDALPGDIAFDHSCILDDYLNSL